MIGKKSKKAGGSQKSVQRDIEDLTDYLYDIDDEDASAKILYTGGRGFIADTFRGRQAEMAALASEAVRSKKPVTHYILSWREGEQPGGDHVEAAVGILLAELGLTDHQAMYALHKNTDNIHLHVAVNRVHPDTLKVIKPNKGFDIEALHKAIAKIEHAQGWQREVHGRYQVTAAGDAVKAAPAQRRRQPGQPQRDVEAITGEKSAVRIAIEQGAPANRQAGSWAELHRLLAERNLRYERAGSGAVIYVGDIPVKASSAAREASLANVERRLGAFQPPANPPVLSPRPPEPMVPRVPGWDGFIAKRKAHYADKAKEASALRQRQAADRERMLSGQKAQRLAILGGNWQGRGMELNAMRMVLAGEQAAERAALKDKFAQERRALQARYPPFPSFEDWLRSGDHPGRADAWRHRHTQPAQAIGGKATPPVPVDIRGFTSEVHGGAVHYFPGGGIAAGLPPSFIDRGGVIDVYASRDEGAVLAVLQLAAQKWGSFAISGDAEFCGICVKLAAAHGFAIVGYEKAIANERQRTGLGPQTPRVNMNPLPQRQAPPEVGLLPHTPRLADLAQTAAAPNAAKAYALHAADILRRQDAAGETVDRSRVDAMAAVRLRVTGHPREAIEAALRNSRRDGESRDWNDYARRTAAYAFSLPGTRQAERLLAYTDRWKQLEGRNPKMEAWAELAAAAWDKVADAFVAENRERFTRLANDADREAVKANRLTGRLLHKFKKLWERDLIWEAEAADFIQSRLDTFYRDDNVSRLLKTQVGRDEWPDAAEAWFRRQWEAENRAFLRAELERDPAGDGRWGRADTPPTEAAGAELEQPTLDDDGSGFQTF